MNPKTLNMLAKCRYQLKFAARRYGSSGSWWKRMVERVLVLSVAIATTSVMVLTKDTSISEAELQLDGRERSYERHTEI